MKYPNFSPLLLKASVAFVIKISAAAAAFFFNIAAVKFLSQTEFGLFSLALSFSMMVAGVAKFGLDSTLIKYMAISQMEGRLFVSNQYYSVCLIIGSLITVLLMGGLLYLDETIALSIFNKALVLGILPLSIFLILPNVLLMLNSQVIKGMQSPYVSLAFTGLVTSLLSLILLVILQPHSAIELLKVVFFSFITTTLLSFIYCFKRLELRITFNQLPYMPIVKTTIPLWGISIVGLLIQQLSVIILGRWGSLNDISLYVVPLKITALMSFGLVAVNTIVTPRFAVLYQKKSLPELRKLVLDSNKILFIFSLILTLPIFIFADQILLLFGSQYQSGVVLLRILILGQMVNLMTGSVSSLLIMTGHERIQHRNVMYIGILTVLLLFTLIPVFGALGAAIGTSLSMSANNILSFYFAHKYVLNNKSHHHGITE